MRVACKCLCLVLASSFAIILTGCNLSQFGEPSRASSVLPAISGKVHGGQQPISGAAIYLYAANTTVSKGASAALLGSPVLTNASGGFSIGAGAYTCPTPGTLVYLVATGGNPGLPGTVNNTAIGLMVLLGTCSSLSTDAFVTVNELTTVAAVEALAPFMADGAHVGSDAGNPGGLAGAFATAASMVNFATGQIQNSAAGMTQPVALLNTLADILAACVNSTGRGSAPCVTLRDYAGLGGAPDTLTATLLIVQYPSQNLAQLFALVGAAVPFSPTLTTAPVNWLVRLMYTPQVPPNGPQYAVGASFIALDIQQHIWVYTNAYQYDPATNSYDISAGSITLFDNNGTILKVIPAGSGGLNNAAQLAPDPFGNMWVLNLGSQTLSKFDPSGNPLSPALGIPLAGISGTSFLALIGGTTTNTISVDPLGNVWVAEYSSPATPQLCYQEFSKSGSEIVVPNHFCLVSVSAAKQ